MELSSRSNLGTVWIHKKGEIEYHPRNKGQEQGENSDSDVEMTMEGISLWAGLRTSKWTWSPLYGAIHQGDSCPDCNNLVEHVSEDAIEGVPF